MNPYLIYYTDNPGFEIPSNPGILCQHPTDSKSFPD